MSKEAVAEEIAFRYTERNQSPDAKKVEEQLAKARQRLQTERAKGRVALVPVYIEETVVLGTQTGRATYDESLVEQVAVRDMVALALIQQQEDVTAMYTKEITHPRSGALMGSAVGMVVRI